MSTLSCGISRYSLPFLASQWSGRKPGMCRILEVFTSMEGKPPADVDSAARRKGGEQRIDETTIMARNAIARGIFSSMGETSGRRQQKRARKVHAQAPANNFSAAYFRKFYLDAATRVVTAEEMRSRAALIASVLKQCQIPVRGILDAGCGIGLLRKPFKE